jgi:hypothetical protein
MSCTSPTRGNMIIYEVKGSGCGLIEILSCHLPESTKENHEIFNQDSRCPGRYTNQALPEYKSKTSMLDRKRVCESCVHLFVCSLLDDVVSISDCMAQDVEMTSE